MMLCVVAGGHPHSHPCVQPPPPADHAVSSAPPAVMGGAVQPHVRKRLQARPHIRPGTRQRSLVLVIQW